ncbi:MAG TPA: PIN domain-containing protein [Methylomirabilota bacterium]|nr:PIN domain-containing protein [Methylomirabilota bacterium]
MSVPFLDTNIIIRFLTQDDPEKFATCKALFERIERGEMSVYLPDVIVGECIFVLTSPRGYNLSRQEVAELLTPLLQLTNIEMQNRQILLRTLTIFAETKDLDFEDAYLIAAMEQAKATDLLSYDSDFDDFPFITRIEPQPLKQAA